jgi:hypothetical protein
LYNIKSIGSGYCLKYTNLKNNKYIIPRHFSVYRKIRHKLLKIRNLFLSLQRSNIFLKKKAKRRFRKIFNNKYNKLVKKKKRAINLQHKMHFTKRKCLYFEQKKKAKHLLFGNRFQSA